VTNHPLIYYVELYIAGVLLGLILWRLTTRRW